MFDNREIKLLTLALDRGASDGEINNAAKMFVRSLRKRGVTVADLIEQEQPDYNMLPSYMDMRMEFGKHKGKLLVDVPGEYLVWVLSNCTNISIRLRAAITELLFDAA